jgi:hypothetical protein
MKVSFYSGPLDGRICEVPFNQLVYRYSDNESGMPHGMYIRSEGETVFTHVAREAVK